MIRFAPRVTQEDARGFLAIFRDHTIPHPGARHVSLARPVAVAEMCADIEALPPWGRACFVAGLLTVGIVDSWALDFMAFYHQLLSRVLRGFSPDPDFQSTLPVFACYLMVTRSRPALCDTVIERLITQIDPGSCLHNCRFSSAQLQQVANLVQATKTLSA